MSRLLFSVVESWFNETRKGTAYCSPVQPGEDSGNLVLHDKHKNGHFMLDHLLSCKVKQLCITV